MTQSQPEPQPKSETSAGPPDKPDHTPLLSFYGDTTYEPFWTAFGKVVMHTTFTGLVLALMLLLGGAGAYGMAMAVAAVSPLFFAGLGCSQGTAPELFVVFLVEMFIAIGGMIVGGLCNQPEAVSAGVTLMSLTLINLRILTANKYAGSTWVGAFWMEVFVAGIAVLIPARYYLHF